MCDLGLPCGKLDWPFTPRNAVETRRIESPYGLNLKKLDPRATIATIPRDAVSLRNLVIRRALHNDPICKFYSVDRDEVLGSNEKQSAIFERIFPNQVDAGSRKPTTLDWMLSRTSDGLKFTAPRELIHLLSCVREVQLKKLELGLPEPLEEALFDRTAFKEALPEVSHVRYGQTLCAEYPDLTKHIEKLRGEKTEHTGDTLASIWKLKKNEAIALAEKLAEVGFFEKRGTANDSVFWVPFLYRDALDLVQGAAE